MLAGCGEAAIAEAQGVCLRTVQRDTQAVRERWAANRADLHGSPDASVARLSAIASRSYEQGNDKLAIQADTAILRFLTPAIKAEAEQLGGGWLSGDVDTPEAA